MTQPNRKPYPPKTLNARVPGVSLIKPASGNYSNNSLRAGLRSLSYATDYINIRRSQIWPVRQRGAIPEAKAIKHNYLPPTNAGIRGRRIKYTVKGTL